MNIPARKRRSSGHDRESIEGFTASFTRAAAFDPTDAKRRRDSASIKQKPSLSFPDADGVTPDRVHGSDFRSFPTIEDVNENEQTSEVTPLLPSQHLRAPDGLSTTAQTIFNMVNLLIGIGLLSLPLGFKLAGWPLGTIMLLFGAILTGYTAILLARTLETDLSVYAYSDIAALAYGRFMTTVVAVIFMLELTAAAAALFILFGDNMHAVIPGISSNVFKLICYILMLPATLLPLRILSYTSIIGIISTVVLIVVILFDGLYKTDAPGSLRDPMPITMRPYHLSDLPIASGLIIALFGGHGVFPNVVADMKDRKQFTKSVWISYSITVAVSLFVGFLGILMFGNGVEAEITINLLKSTGYPRAPNQIAVLMAGITSLTKAPLCTKSISTNIDSWFGLHGLKIEAQRGWRGLSLHLIIRLIVNTVVLLIAVYVPAFEKVMSILGSSFVFLISAILPLAFYVKIMQRSKHRSLSVTWRMTLYSLNGISIMAALVGTIFALLPDKAK